MTCVKFRLRDGGERSVDARENESLMKAAVRNSVPGIEGECGGEMTCATCHVHVPSPWKDRVRPPSQEELDLLEMVDDVTNESRLGCQVRVTPEVEGLTATIATTD